jgi:hypothetical protein
MTRTTRGLLRAAAIAVIGSAAVVPQASSMAAALHSSDRGSGTYITSVRIGHHAGYDRLVLTFHGRLPTHSVKYVNTVRADPSGKVVGLEGKARLRVVVHPTSTFAHQPQSVWTPRLPEIRQVKGAGNFEGYTSFGVGLSAHRPYRVLTLTGPNRLVIDVELPQR